MANIITATAMSLIHILIAKIERSVMAAGAWGVIASFIVMYALALILNRKKLKAEKIDSELSIKED